MKKIITICLVVGLMIACTDNNSVDDVKQTDAPQVLYKGSFYRMDDDKVQSIVTSSSMLFRADFEDYERLFDTEQEFIQFLESSYSGKYAPVIKKLLHPDLTMTQQSSKPLGSTDPTSSKNGSSNSRVENTIYDFELAFLDGPCGAYPVTPYYLDLPTYPSGVMSDTNYTIGYWVRSMDYAIPPGGAISFVYHDAMHSCATGSYLATSSGCRNTSYTSCFSDPHATYLGWGVILDY